MASNLKKHIRIAKRNSKITPKLHAWLNNNPDGIKIASEEVAAKVMDILKPSSGDRSGVFHPSELYNCQRHQIFNFFGAPAKYQSYNPTLQNLFNDGHFRHLRWQIMLLNAGILTDVEVGVSMPEYRLGGSMDGVNDKAGWMFELKGTSQYAQVLRSGAMPAHIKQVNTYLMASGLEQALIVYECKSSQQWVEIEVNKDPDVINELEEILQSLNSAMDTGVMPEVLDDCKNKTGAKFQACPHNETCLGVGRTEEISTFVPVGPRVTNSSGNENGNRRVRFRVARS